MIEIDMKPKPFISEPYQGSHIYIKNKTDGLIWHRSQHRTLYADTDRSGAIYHSNYLHYFEFGRTSLMRDAAYPYKEIEECGYVYPIIEIGIKYYTPLFYDDLMWIHTRPSKLERVKVRFNYIIVLADTTDIICEGFTWHCAVNNGKPTAVDEKTASLWKNFPE